MSIGAGVVRGLQLACCGGLVSCVFVMDLCVRWLVVVLGFEGDCFVGIQVCVGLQ